MIVGWVILQSSPRCLRRVSAASSTGQTESTQQSKQWSRRHGFSAEVALGMGHYDEFIMIQSLPCPTAFIMARVAASSDRYPRPS